MSEASGPTFVVPRVSLFGIRHGHSKRHIANMFVHVC